MPSSILDGQYGLEDGLPVQFLSHAVPVSSVAGDGVGYSGAHPLLVAERPQSATTEVVPRGRVSVDHAPQVRVFWGLKIIWLRLSHWSVVSPAFDGGGQQGVSS